MRPHIGIFGVRNSGKSSLINAITEQNISIVSETPGTTTDPVGKAMEILPLGPVYILDTAGFDDTGYLGNKRTEKSLKTLRKTDLIVLVTTIDSFHHTEKIFIESYFLKSTVNRKLLVVFNKHDLPYSEEKKQHAEIYLNNLKIDYVYASAKTGENIPELRVKLSLMIPEVITNESIINDLLSPQDIVLQIIPIDSSAPKGRIILPQERVLREALDNHSLSICIQPQEIDHVLSLLKKKPDLVITDSQAIKYVAEHIPNDILLTTYSILFSRLKGELLHTVEAISTIAKLQDNDIILIAEACTHHSQSDDIGKVKIPRWLQEYTGKDLKFVVNQGKMFTQTLEDVKLIVHCGGCMINRKEMLARIDIADRHSIPITNYGILISHMHNTLQRTIKPFPDAYSLYKEIISSQQRI